MASYQRTKGSIRAKNIGGIDETQVEFSNGTTVLVGRNATNRTSFLQAVMAALGSENASIKGDSEQASVELTFDGETYERQLKRRNGTVVADGDPYLHDPTLADLFAFLLESNEARRAVRANDDLRELIMRPVDTDQIESRIDELVQQRQSLKDELSDIQDLKGKLPELEKRRHQLVQDIEAKKEQIDEKNKQLTEADTDVEQKRKEKSKLDKKLDQLNDKRSALDDIRYSLETERESLEALREKKQEVKRELEEQSVQDSENTEDIESEIERLRDRKQNIQTEANKIQNVISFNEEMLEDSNTVSLPDSADSSSEEITDQLLPEETIQCWTCGSDVQRTKIESTIEQLRELNQTKMSELRELDDEISELTDRQRERQQIQQKRNRLQRELENTEAEIDQAETEIDRLQSKREDLTADIEQLEEKVDQLESDSDNHILTLHKEANQLEYELGNLENDFQRVEDNISELEAEIERENEIETQIESVSEEITEYRTTIERLQKDAVEEFNQHMETVLELLDYDNLDRIWIERVEKDVREGRKKVTKHSFELHVVRTSGSGTVYEDTVDHLSESEREVTGLVFALAGYLAHEVYEEVPIMLLDSLEAIDSERTARLIDYLTEYAEYLLVALLPEDARAVPDEYDRIQSI